MSEREEVRVFEDWRRQLREMSMAGRSRPEICDAIADAARLRAALDAFEARAAAEIERLGDKGAPASTVLRSASRCSQREADRRARRATVLQALPEAADALADGRLTGEHVENLSRAVEATSPEAVAASDLVEKACRRPADLAARDTRDWVRREQTEAEIEAVQRRRRSARRLSIWENDDGMTVLHGEFDPVTGAELRGALEAEVNRLFRADGGLGDAGDVRTPEQRRADALTGLLTGASAGGSGPVRYQIPVVATVADGAITGGRLADGSAVPLAEVERLACGSDLFGLLFSGDGKPLWHGDRVRLATDDQWRALVARDGGCVFCSAGPGQCEAHHVIPWLVGGATDITNLVLLCRHHHHLVHDCGFRIVETADGWELVPP
ncbi:MAG: DUF222 domain-containing protein [Actinomycetota bacterium]